MFPKIKTAFHPHPVASCSKNNFVVVCPGIYSEIQVLQTLRLYLNLPDGS